MASEDLLGQIEEAALALLMAHWPTKGGATSVNQFDAAGDLSDILKTPAISLRIEKIGIRKLDMDGSTELAPVLSIYLAFKDAAKPDARRRGVYPMVFGTAEILIGQKLGLEIAPLQLVGEIGEISHEQARQLGLTVFKVDLETSFDIDSSFFGERNAAQLLKIASDYFFENPLEDEAELKGEVALEGHDD